MIIGFHPHAISLEEVTNHELELIVGKTIDQSLRNWSIKLDELFGPFQLPSRLVSIDTSPCRLFNGQSCHLSVNLEDKPLWAMKLLNIDACVIALERKYQLLELEEYRFHAFEDAILYKESVNDANVLVKFMP